MFRAARAEEENLEELTLWYVRSHIEGCTLEVQDIAIVIEIDRQIADIFGIAARLNDEHAMTAAVYHLGGIVAARLVRPGRIARVQEGVRMGANNDIDDIARICGDHLVHIVAAVRDDNDDVGALLLQQACLLADGVALVAEDQLARVGQCLRGDGGSEREFGTRVRWSTYVCCL